MNNNEQRNNNQQNIFNQNINVQEKEIDANYSSNLSTVKDKAEKYIVAYIGNNHDKILNGKFNFAAFFLSYFYTAYRKYYHFSIVLYLVSIIISIITIAIGSYYDNPAIGDTFMYITYIPVAIITGFMFNKMYIKYVKKNINKIRNDNPNMTDDELCNVCNSHGRPSIVISILFFVAFVIIVSVIRALIMGIN